MMCGGSWGGGVKGVGDFLGFGVSQARLHTEVQPCTVFPLGPLYADPVRQHF